RQSPLASRVNCREPASTRATLWSGRRSDAETGAVDCRNRADVIRTSGHRLRRWELRAGAVAHQADGVELGLLAGVLLGALAHLVALVEQLDLLHFLERLAERGLGILELRLELLGRALEVLAPLHRRLGIGRIGEMSGIVDAGALLLGADLAIEIGPDALELC